MSDYEDEDSVSSEGDVGEDSASGGGEDEASDREFAGVGGEEELDISASDPEVAVESGSDKEGDGFERRSQSGSDGSVVGDEERDDPGNEDDEFDEETGHTRSVPIISGHVRVAKQGSGDISEEGSPGSDYDEAVELATNRQGGFSDADSQSDEEAAGRKGHEDRDGLNEVDTGEKEEDLDNFKDTSDVEPDDKGSDEDYQVRFLPDFILNIALVTRTPLRRGFPGVNWCPCYTHHKEKQLGSV